MKVVRKGTLVRKEDLNNSTAGGIRAAQGFALFLSWLVYLVI